MSSPEALAPALYSCQELLAFDEDQLVQFLDDCRTPHHGFDISRVVGVDGLSEGQRGEFSVKLSAAAEKAGPLNSNLLSRLLGNLVANDRAGGKASSSQREHVRSPTCSPIPEDDSRFEAYCHDELVKAGGRPVMSFELLLHNSKDAKANREGLEPWLSDTDPGSRDGNVPPVFSTQLEDWESFKHQWQWDNRGKYAGDEGFFGFLESKRKRWLHMGEPKVVSDPTFEDTTRHIWEYKERYLELSGTEGFAAYMQAVERRLASHHFTQPFQLAEDPRQQDARTTWVEYLSYVYWWRDRHAAAMEAAVPRYRQAWDELHHFDASPLATTSTTTGALDEELGAARVQLEMTRQQIRKFIRGTKAYRRGEMAVRRQELRAQWVLEQLPLINPTSSPDHASTEESSGANSSEKRKAGDDHDILPRQRPKRRRQEVDHSGSAPDPEPGTGKGSDMVMPDETAATSTTASAGPRRSQRVRARVTAAEASSPKLPPEARGLRKTRRQGSTHEKSLGPTASQTSRGRKGKPKKVVTATEAPSPKLPPEARGLRKTRRQGSTHEKSLGPTASQTSRGRKRKLKKVVTKT
ncbi:MAG: hypothetical protein M1817_003669 [Caeruleum heppii]|nr:MAG: hypothetical protein M1817_003669 [Caeruleum heppii]